MKVLPKIVEEEGKEDKLRDCEGETPEIKWETPEIKWETPEIKWETPEIKYDQTELSDSSKEIVNDVILEGTDSQNRNNLNDAKVTTQEAISPFQFEQRDADGVLNDPKNLGSNQEESDAESAIPLANHFTQHAPVNEHIDVKDISATKESQPPQPPQPAQPPPPSSAESTRLDSSSGSPKMSREVSGSSSKSLKTSVGSSKGRRLYLGKRSGSLTGASAMSREISSLDLIQKHQSLFLEAPGKDETTFHVPGFQKKNERLEEVIKLHHLEQLCQEFSQHKPKDIVVQEGSGYFPSKLLKRTPGCMDLVEFKSTVSKVLKTDEYDEYLEKLFMKLDTSCDGYVDWNEFCTYMLLLYRENDYLRTKREIPFLCEPKIRHVVHNRQEQTSRIVAIHGNGPTRYVTISKEGAMSIWQPNMAFEKYYTISDLENEQTNQKRRFKMWVTDAIYMKNCQKMAIGSTSRDIRFYDVSSSQYFEEYHLFAMSDVPYCFDYYFDTQYPNTESLLIFGVDTGAIHLLKFMKPITQLFQTPFKSDGGVQKIFMQDLPCHNQWVTHSILLDIHPEMIIQVRYLPENDAIISSSASPKNTVVISDVQGVKKSYVFRIEKGVECFDHNKNLNLLVTGSGDHVVRLWNPYVTNKAVASLFGHATGVIGVAIHEGFRQVFTYSKEAVIKVWDTKEHTCLQTIVLKFPSSIHGRMPENGQFPMHLQGSPQNALLVTCNDYIGLLRLGKVEHNISLMELTHNTQLCSAIYNKFLKQVATGCDSSTIAVWDIETGNKSIMFSNAHGEEEITSMTFDSTYRRLISGARNGTIKVWNFQNGHNLHKLEPVGEAEVTGLHVLPEKRVILSVGWSQKIILYDDSDADNMYINADHKWKGHQLHKDDILCSDYCPPNFLATAGFDGEIIVWDVDTEKVYIRLRKGQQPNVSKKLEALKTRLVEGENGTVSHPSSRPSSRPSSQNSRPNSRHRSSHKAAKGQPVPVDKLLFLKARASIRFTESALLISSEAGVLRWWAIYNAQNKEMGHFYAPAIGDESVLAMCTKPNDSLLITGDTQGMVRCWDIMEYCTKPDTRATKANPPPLETMWKAHDSAIVSVEYIVHDAGSFVLTASTDKTARLWSPDGHYIGTFGQKESWILKDPSKWAHPATPWTKEEEREAAEKGPKVKSEEAIDLESTTHGDESLVAYQDIDTGRTSVGANGVEESMDDRADTTLNQCENMTSRDEIEPQLEMREISSSCLPVPPQANGTPPVEHHPRTPSSRPISVLISAATPMPVDLPHCNYRMKYRSQTFAYGFHRVERSKTFLGIKVEKDLARRQKDRKGRRVQYGEIAQGKTSQFGKHCSPFHALTTPDWKEVQLPSNLPLSQRMLNRGYTSNNLTQESIRTMDLSYGMPETPTATTRGQSCGNIARGLTPGITSARADKNTRLPPIKPSSLKKSPTVL